MVIYFFVWILLVLPHLGNKKLGQNEKFNKFYFIYAITILTVLIGFRDLSVGADTSYYGYLYETAHLRIGHDYYDRGYYLLTFLLREMGLTYRAFLIVIAGFISVILVLYYNRHSKNLAFSVFIFMTIGLLPMYMTGTRQVMAISLCLVALMCMDKRKYLLSVVLVFLASRFHASAIVFYVMLPLSRIQLTKRGVWILIFMASCVFLYSELLIRIATYILPEKYQKIDMNAGYEINPLLIIIAVLIPAFCIFFDKTDRYGKIDQQSSVLYAMSCLNIVFTMLALNSMYFSRLGYYFVHANSLLIPNVVFAQRRRNNRIIMMFVIVSLCALYFIISIPGGTLKIDQYKFFW